MNSGFFHSPKKNRVLGRTWVTFNLSQFDIYFFLAFFKIIPIIKNLTLLPTIPSLLDWEGLGGGNQSVSQGLMIQNSKTKITSWLIILALLFSIPGCGGSGSDSNTGGQEVIVIGPPDPSGPAIYSVTLAWDAPTTNVDGSPLTDLSGYRIYYGTSSGVFTSEINVGNVTTYSISNLSQGTYYFAVKAYDAEGNYSEYSSPTYGLCVNVSETNTYCVH